LTLKSALVFLILISFEAVSADPVPAVEAKRLISASAEGWDFFFGSCSWYCGSPAIKVASSSFLTERDDLKHSATQVQDGNMGKVWSEEVKGNGIGESLTFTFHTTKEDTTDLGVTSCAIGI
jgi:hypothetical protein